jgi:hypothetical protein
MPPVSTSASNLPAHLDGQSAAWQRWRDQRLQRHEQSSQAATILHLPAGASPDAADLADLCLRTQRDGLAQFRIEGSNQRASLSILLAALGLTLNDEGVIRGDDGLSLLQDHGTDARARFVPYSNRQMNWHTDGYYNADDQSLRCFVLHCLRPAAQGGELYLLDPELLLIELYRQTPEIVELLSHPEAICLPANTDRHGHDRPDRYTSVFACHDDATLSMRYTTRSRNIRFRNQDTEHAMQQLQTAIDACKPWHRRLRLEAGQGILCRNLLHWRASFSDPDGQPGRQILRGRYTQLPSLTADTPHAARQ